MLSAQALLTDGQGARSQARRLMQALRRSHAPENRELLSATLIHDLRLTSTGLRGSDGYPVRNSPLGEVLPRRILPFPHARLRYR